MSKQKHDTTKLIAIAQHFAEQEPSLRDLGKMYNIFKSWMHVFMTKKLPSLDKELADKCAAVSQKHRRRHSYTSNKNKALNY